MKTTSIFNQLSRQSIGPSTMEATINLSII